VTEPRGSDLTSRSMAQIGFAPAADVAFGIVFGVFVLAFLVLAFVAIRWGVRRDRPGRQAWRQRHFDAAARASQTSANGSAGANPRDDGRP
jgi:hypothetical protein